MIIAAHTKKQANSAICKRPEKKYQRANCNDRNLSNVRKALRTAYADHASSFVIIVDVLVCCIHNAWIVFVFQRRLANPFARMTDDF